MSEVPAIPELDTTDDFEPNLFDPLPIAIAKAEIRGALLAFASVDELIADCAAMAIEHDLHDDLTAGLVALSEDLRLHVRDKILPLRSRFP